MIFAGATNETALAHSFPYSILFHFPGRSDSAHRISNITFIILNIKQSHLRVTAKNKIRLSTVSKKQLQTMVVVVSVVQFHMTTRLNFTLVNLSTSYIVNGGTLNFLALYISSNICFCLSAVRSQANPIASFSGSWGKVAIGCFVFLGAADMHLQAVTKNRGDNKTKKGRDCIEILKRIEFQYGGSKII